MNSEEQAIDYYGRLFDAMIRIRLAAQRRNLEKDKEPRLVAELTGAAPLALQRAKDLLQGFDDAEWTPQARDQMKLALAREFMAVAKERAAGAQALLQDLLRQEVEGLSEIVSTNGVTLDMAELRGRVLPDDDALAHLASAGAMEHYTKKSCLEFTRKVIEALNQAWGRGQGGGGLAAGLEEAAQFWQGRLKTIAVTTLHRVAGQAKQAVYKGLRQ